MSLHDHHRAVANLNQDQRSRAPALLDRLPRVVEVAGDARIAFQVAGTVDHEPRAAGDVTPARVTADVLESRKIGRLDRHEPPHHVDREALEQACVATEPAHSGEEADALVVRLRVGEVGCVDEGAREAALRHSVAVVRLVFGRVDFRLQKGEHHVVLRGGANFDHALSAGILRGNSGWNEKLICEKYPTKTGTYHARRRMITPPSGPVRAPAASPRRSRAGRRRDSRRCRDRTAPGRTWPWPRDRTAPPFRV